MVLTQSALWRLCSCALVALAIGLALAVPGIPARAAGRLARLPATPTSAITSPASASGPIQTGVQVKGQGWNAGETIKLFYNTPDCGDPANAPTLSQSQGLPVGNLSADQGGAWVANFQWPGTNTGAFAICAFDPNTPGQVIAANRTFQVLSTAVPTIATPLPAFFNAGDQVLVNLTNFLPGNQPVDVKITDSLANQSQATLLATVTVDTNGNASQQVTLPTTLSGNLQMFAASHPAPGAAAGVLPPLFASQALSVGAASPTPTPTSTAAPDPTVPPTATAAPVSTGGAETTPKSSSASAILTLLVALLGLVILAIFGVLIWYFVGIRPPANGLAPPMAPPPARTRAPVGPRGGMRGGYAPQEEDEWEDQQGPWEEDMQGGWSGGDWGGNAPRRDQRGGAPPRSGGFGGGSRVPPPRTGTGGPPRPPRPGPRDAGHPSQGQDDW